MQRTQHGTIAHRLSRYEDGMILQDELRRVHHGHMGRLLSMLEEGGNGNDLMMGLEEDDRLVMGMDMRGD